jgi:hypothetical protein
VAAGGFEGYLTRDINYGIFLHANDSRRYGKMKIEVIEKLAALVTAAFGLVAALAWNGAIQAIFKAVFGTADSIPAMLTYAVLVTIIAVLVIIWIARVANRAKVGK